jgi:hypothetical protein
MDSNMGKGHLDDNYRVEALLSSGDVGRGEPNLHLKENGGRSDKESSRIKIKKCVK